MVLNTHFIWVYTSIGKIYLALTIFLLIMILQCALIMAVIFIFLRGEYFLRNREFPFLPFFDWRRGQTRYKISIIFPVAQKTINNCPKWISDTFLWDWHWFRKVPTLWIILRIFGPVKIPPFILAAVCFGNISLNKQKLDHLPLVISYNVLPYLIWYAMVALKLSFLSTSGSYKILCEPGVSVSLFIWAYSTFIVFIVSSAIQQT